MRLLLVEDNKLNQEFFSDVLAGVGHDVVLVDRGAAGLAHALAESFDLVLVDIQLPDLNGDELCRRLRSSGVTRPIVALSSAALPDQVQRGMAAGFDAYLTKPISPAALREAVLRYAREAG